MFQVRLIPVLLLKDGVLVKSRRFGEHLYVGDPINAIRILSEFECDELILLDTSARSSGRDDLLPLLRAVSGIATMPIAVGGGIRDLSRIATLVREGAEKVVLCSHAVAEPAFVEEAALEFGSSTISVCLDVGPASGEGQVVWTANGTTPTAHEPVQFAKLMEQHGAGEIILQSIERDGGMDGYDLALVGEVANNVSIPVVALGGAGSLGDMEKGHAAGASALAAGSAFVYFRKRGAVLVNYPARAERRF